MDYGYVKKRAGHENREYEKKLEAFEAEYFALEDKVLEKFLEDVHKCIERNVYFYYKDGKCANIHEIGTLFKRYTLTEKGWSFSIFYRHQIQNQETAYPLKDPLKPFQYQFAFPSEKCLHSFLRKANQSLCKEQIEISIRKTTADSTYFFIFAKLGKL